MLKLITPNYYIGWGDLFFSSIIKVNKKNYAPNISISSIKNIKNAIFYIKISLYNNAYDMYLYVILLKKLKSQIYAFIFFCLTILILQSNLF